jgi:Mrp family chromosome partitioning ATPase
MKWRFVADEQGDQGFPELPARQWNRAVDFPNAANGAREYSGRTRTDTRERGIGVLDPVAMQQCESIQTRLWLNYVEGSMKTVSTFVGATGDCGVSTVAANFAAAVGQGASSRVLLIAFGTKRPLRLGMHQEPDLGRWLDDKCVPVQPSPNMPPSVYLLSSETLGPTVATVLQSRAFDDFLTRARERFDHVVVDAPPLQSHPESLLLCRKSDSVVLVVRAGRTRHQTAAWARQQIENVGGNLAGVVLNRRRYYIPRWLYRML